MEIACAVWARALLNLVYDFIDKETKRFGRIPFNIPRFRFVELALAMEHDSATRGRQNYNSIFLLEEVIAEDQQGPFRKYLNNVSPTPLVMSSPEDDERAKFLSFSQHVQYVKTMKQAFVSDYQGKQYEQHQIFCMSLTKWFNLPTDYSSMEYT